MKSLVIKLKVMVKYMFVLGRKMSFNSRGIVGICSNTHSIDKLFNNEYFLYDMKEQSTRYCSKDVALNIIRNKVVLNSRIYEDDSLIYDGDFFFSNKVLNCRDVLFYSYYEGLLIWNNGLCYKINGYTFLGVPLSDLTNNFIEFYIENKESGDIVICKAFLSSNKVIFSCLGTIIYNVSEMSSGYFMRMICMS